MSSLAARGRNQRSGRTKRDWLSGDALWCVTPGKGLGGLLLVGFFFSVIADRSGVAWQWYLVAVVGCWWLAIILVAAPLPPPVPLCSRSALALRVGCFAKALWRAAVFGAAAAYGALVSIDINSLPQDASGSALATKAWQTIWPLIQLTAVAAGWYTAMACAWDLWRSGADARKQAIHTHRTKVESLTPSWQPPPPIADWLEAAMQWCVGGFRPFVAAYIAPVAVAVAQNVLR